MGNVAFQMSPGNQYHLINYMQEQAEPIRETIQLGVDEARKGESYFQCLGRGIRGIFPSPRRIGQVGGALYFQGLAAEHGPAFVRAGVEAVMARLMPGLAAQSTGWFSSWGAGVAFSALTTSVVGYCTPIFIAGAGVVGAAVGALAVVLILETGRYIYNRLTAEKQKPLPVPPEWNKEQVSHELSTLNILKTDQDRADLEMRINRHNFAVKLCNASSKENIDVLFKERAWKGDNGKWVASDGYELNEKEVRRMETALDQLKSEANNRLASEERIKAIAKTVSLLADHGAQVR